MRSLGAHSGFLLLGATTLAEITCQTTFFQIPVSAEKRSLVRYFCSMTAQTQSRKMSHRKLLLVIGLLTSLASCLIVWLYLTSPYEPIGATSVAKTFVSEASQGNWRLAHELTLKNGYTGRTPDELRQAWKQQHCGEVSMVSWGPPQSHGNRLRRWLKGLPLDQDRIRVEFNGDLHGSICMMSFEIRPTERSQWKVFNFQSHAG